MKIACIGLGNMGSGIAGRIQQAGFTLAVYNRTAAKTQPFADAGARAGTSVPDTVRDADVVVSCLMDDASVMALIDAGLLEAMQPGAIHLGVTTISPACADELARRHAASGTCYVAGPVMGRPDAAARGELIAYLAGAPEAINQVTPVCSAYARKLVPVGPHHATANNLKLCINYAIVSFVELFGEIYTLAEATEAPAQLVEDFFQMAFAAPGLKNYASKIRARDFDGPMGFAMTAGLKDVKLMADAHQRAGIPFEIGAIIQGKMEQAIGQGMKDRDWSAIYEITRGRAGQG